jgi:hypothetical protein
MVISGEVRYFGIIVTNRNRPVSANSGTVILNAYTVVCNHNGRKVAVVKRRSKKSGRSGRTKKRLPSRDSRNALDGRGSIPDSRRGVFL